MLDNLFLNGLVGMPKQEKKEHATQELEDPIYMSLRTKTWSAYAVWQMK